MFKLPSDSARLRVQALVQKPLRIDGLVPPTPSPRYRTVCKGPQAYPIPSRGRHFQWHRNRRIGLSGGRTVESMTANTASVNRLPVNGARRYPHYC
jgi:hypothetical protein